MAAEDPIPAQAGLPAPLPDMEAQQEASDQEGSPPRTDSLQPLPLPLNHFKSISFRRQIQVHNPFGAAAAPSRASSSDVSWDTAAEPDDLRTSSAGLLPNEPPTPNLGHLRRPSRSAPVVQPAPSQFLRAQQKLNHDDASSDPSRFWQRFGGFQSDRPQHEASSSTESDTTAGNPEAGREPPPMTAAGAAAADRQVKHTKTFPLDTLEQARIKALAWADSDDAEDSGSQTSQRSYRQHFSFPTTAAERAASSDRSISPPPPLRRMPWENAWGSGGEADASDSHTSFSFTSIGRQRDDDGETDDLGTEGTDDPCALRVSSSRSAPLSAPKRVSSDEPHQRRASYPERISTSPETCRPASFTSPAPCRDAWGNVLAGVGEDAALSPGFAMQRSAPLAGQFRNAQHHDSFSSESSPHAAPHPRFTVGSGEGLGKPQRSTNQLHRLACLNSGTVTALEMQHPPGFSGPSPMRRSASSGALASSDASTPSQLRAAPAFVALSAGEPSPVGSVDGSPSSAPAGLIGAGAAARAIKRVLNRVSADPQASPSSAPSMQTPSKAGRALWAAGADAMRPLTLQYLQGRLPGSSGPASPASSIHSSAAGPATPPRHLSLPSALPAAYPPRNASLPTTMLPYPRYPSLPSSEGTGANSPLRRSSLSSQHSAPPVSHHRRSSLLSNDTTTSAANSSRRVSLQSEGGGPSRRSSLRSADGILIAGLPPRHVSLPLNQAERPAPQQPRNTSLPALLLGGEAAGQLLPRHSTLQSWDGAAPRNPWKLAPPQEIHAERRQNLPSSTSSGGGTPPSRDFHTNGSLSPHPEYQEHESDLYAGSSLESAHSGSWREGGPGNHDATAAGTGSSHFHGKLPVIQEPAGTPRSQQQHSPVVSIFAQWQSIQRVAPESANTSATLSGSAHSANSNDADTLSGPRHSRVSFHSEIQPDSEDEKADQPAGVLMWNGAPITESSWSIGAPLTQADDSFRGSKLVTESEWQWEALRAAAAKGVDLEAGGSGGGGEGVSEGGGGLGFWARKVASRCQLAQRSEESIVKGLMMRSFAITRGTSWTGASTPASGPHFPTARQVSHGCRPDPPGRPELEDWWARPRLIYCWLVLSILLFAMAIVRMALMFWLLIKLVMTPIDMVVSLLGIWGSASYLRAAHSQGHSRSVPAVESIKLLCVITGVSALLMAVATIITIPTLYVGGDCATALNKGHQCSVEQLCWSPHWMSHQLCWNTNGIPSIFTRDADAHTFWATWWALTLIAIIFEAAIAVVGLWLAVRASHVIRSGGGLPKVSASKTVRPGTLEGTGGELY